MSDDKLGRLLSIVDTLSPDSPKEIRQEVFQFIRRWWAEVGANVEVRDLVCKKLNISHQLFNLYLTNPELVHGFEYLHRNIKPGWLKTYLEYTAGHEAPEEFHVWVGLTIIGATLRRKVWYDNVYYKLYPNLYTVLVAPPGVGKKTTAIDIGIKLLRAACPNVKIISEKITPEALARKLSRGTETRKETGGIKVDVRAEAIAVAPELTVFLGREQYNEGLIILLTRLYDCADVVDVDTISRGTESLRNVCFSLLGATTPSEISKAIPASATGSGFMSRLIIIQRDSSPRTVPFAVPVDPTLRELLISQLAKIEKEVAGPFVFTEDGTKWFKDYYFMCKSLREKGTIGMNTERQPDQVQKVAMIMAVAEGAPMELNEDILQRSFNIVNSASSSASELSKMIDTNERGKNAQLILDHIKRKGGVIGRSELIKAVYRRMNKVELDLVIPTLEEAGLIVAFDLVSDKGKKNKFYRITSFEEE